MATEASRLDALNAMPLRRRRTAFRLLLEAWRAGSLSWRPVWRHGKIANSGDSKKLAARN